MAVEWRRYSRITRCVTADSPLLYGVCVTNQSTNQIVFRFVSNQPECRVYEFHSRLLYIIVEGGDVGETGAVAGEGGE